MSVVIYFVVSLGIALSVCLNYLVAIPRFISVVRYLFLYVCRSLFWLSFFMSLCMYFFR